jgi:hypothetical protein
VSDEKLRPLTVYLPPEEVDALEREAREQGRSGASAQIRFILAERRRDA